MGSTEFVPRFQDLVTMHRASVMRHAAKPFLGIKKGDGFSWISHADFGRRVEAVTRGLARLGIKRGDKIGIIARNRLEWAECAYAAFTSGAVIVPMYEHQLARDWMYILADSGAVACFTATKAIAATLEAARADMPKLAHIVPFEGNAYEDLVAGAREISAPRVSVGPSDEAVYLYTSGTTGNPKGVRLAHGSLTANLCAVEQVFGARDDEKFMSILPWAHAGGLLELNLMTLFGASTAICPGPEAVLETFALAQPTWVCSVPRVWSKFREAVNAAMAGRPSIVRRLYARAMNAGTRRRKGLALGPKDHAALAFAERVLYPKILAKLGGKLHTISVGAAALGEDLGHFLENLGIRVIEVYGQTEASPIATSMIPGEAGALGSVGRPLPGLRLELDHDVPGGDAENGELIIHGHCVMLGYHGLPAEDARALTPNRGLRTGDLARIDARGLVYITGRVKEVYKLDNGKFVAPAPIEERMCTSPFIAQAMVHGLNKPHNVALVVADIGVLTPWCKERGIDTGDKAKMLADPSVRALIAHEIDTRTRDLKGYERVKGFVLTPEELTLEGGMLTPTLKVKRREVLAKYGEALDALYAPNA